MPIFRVNVTMASFFVLCLQKVCGGAILNICRNNLSIRNVFISRHKNCVNTVIV